MGQESYWIGDHRVHVALYRMAVRKGRLIRMDASMSFTGPRIELAIELIKRMKVLFNEKLELVFDTKETVIQLNGCHIEAYPSHHLACVP